MEGSLGYLEKRRHWGRASGISQRPHLLLFALFGVVASTPATEVSTSVVDVVGGGVVVVGSMTAPSVGRLAAPGMAGAHRGSATHRAMKVPAKASTLRARAAASTARMRSPASVVGSGASVRMTNPMAHAPPDGPLPEREARQRHWPTPSVSCPRFEASMSGVWSARSRMGWTPRSNPASCSPTTATTIATAAVMPLSFSPSGEPGRDGVGHQRDWRDQ